jgi:phage terminase large subunit GpA-like protein
MKKTPTKRKEVKEPDALKVRGTSIARASSEWFAAFKPKRRIPLSQWMAEEGRLDDGSKFRPFPFQNGIADAFTDPATAQVSVRKSSRIGYSTIVQCFLGYRISRDPARSLIYQPTIDDAEKYSRDDLDPVLQWPAVRAVATFKARDRDNQIRAKRFKGGWIQIKGANSPKEFRRVTADDVLLEECDGYPYSAREEGDPARLAFKRNLTSPRRFSAAGSTPKIKGLSRIDSLFEQGTQEFRYVPCPHCGTLQTLEFGDGTGAGIRWAPKHRPTRAWYQCVNGCEIDEADKAWMDEHGEWRAHNPEAGPRHRSFHIWAAYSQHAGAAWLEIAKEFLEVRKDPNLLKTFVNQVLGLAFEERGEAPEWQRLYDRREKDMAIGTPPAWTGILVGAIDVQQGAAGDNRLEMDVWAFGPGRSRALVEHIEVDGALADKATWTKLDKEIARTWESADGRELRLVRVGIDSGDGKATMQVYAWARKHPGFVMALKGRDGLAAGQAVAGPTWMDLTIGGKKLKKGVRLWTVGTSMLKLELYGQLQLEKPVDGEAYPEGYIYLPDGTTDEWIKQLCAEQLIEVKRRNGRVRREWHQTRPRNEALDNAVYARAVAIAIGVDRWRPQDWAKVMGKPVEVPRTKPEPPRKAGGIEKKQPKPGTKPVRKQQNWLGPKRSDWMSRRR